MADALAGLAEQLRREDTPISPHVEEPGPGQAFTAGERSWVIEAVREGYLLHYAEPRLLAGHDDDLALLAGDYLYALGIERLAEAGDVVAVKALAELIGECARLHVEDRPAEAQARWQRTVAALGATRPRSP